MNADRSEKRPPRTRAAATNKPLAHLDGRTAAGRRIRDVLERLEAETKRRKGAPQVVGREHLLHRAATLVAEIERIEADLARGQRAELDRYARLTALLARLLLRLGGPQAAAPVKSAKPVPAAPPAEPFVSQFDPLSLLSLDRLL
jgi:hypothetical protein